MAREEGCRIKNADSADTREGGMAEEYTGSGADISIRESPRASPRCSFSVSDERARMRVHVRVRGSVPFVYLP